MTPTKNNPTVQEWGNDSRESIKKTYDSIITSPKLIESKHKKYFFITQGKWNGAIIPRDKVAAQLDSQQCPEIAYDKRGKSKLKNGLSLVKRDESICVHLVVDTEFGVGGGVIATHSSPRKHLSTQVKGFGMESDEARLFFLPTIASTANEARERCGLKPCPTLQSVFVAADYLSNMGHVVSLKRSGNVRELNALPDCDFIMYAHFAVAELNLLAQGELADDILQAQRDGYIKQARRVVTSPTNNGRNLVAGAWKSNWIVSINGKDYRLCLGIIDTIGLQGNASYTDLANNVGVKLKYKDTLTATDKSDMEKVILNRPEVFANYALGDLQIDEILIAYESLIRNTFKELGLEAYYVMPKATIGATVAQLIKAALRSKLKLEDDEAFESFVDNYLTPNSPAHILDNHRDSRVLLQKVQGGRCGAADGRVINVKGDLIDNDIKGCYGEMMRYQRYPIGKPEIMSFDDSSHNQYPTLAEWLHGYGVRFKDKRDYLVSDWGELLNGLWQLRFTVTDLPFKQTLFESWVSGSFNPNMTTLRKHLVTDYKSDTERDETKPFSVDYGNLKILQHEIHNAVLTHDLFQLFLSVLGRADRHYFLNNARVIASEVHPASQQCESLEEVIKRRAEWDGNNTIIRKLNRKNNRPFILRKECECYAWYSLSMGELIVDDLLAKRQEAERKDCDVKTKEERKASGKTPQETAYKLMVNTIYGDMASPHFVISRPLVGNNVTARARCVAYMMEVGLGCFQTITDGGVHPNHFPGVTDMNELATLHWDKLARQFPKLDVVCKESTAIQLVKNESGEYDRTYTPRKGLFSFEIKCTANTFTGHGSANYLIQDNYSGKWIYKSRGYEGKQHQGWELSESGELKQTDDYKSVTPFAHFQNQLRDNPNAVERSKLAVKTGILKISEYAKCPAKWDEIGLVPGDTIHKLVTVSELSLSQFRFKTLKQCASWDKAHQRLKDGHKQSLELFFLNQDGTLDYERMINWVWEAIEAGVDDPLKELDKSEHRHRKVLDHPAKACGDLVAKQFTNLSEDARLRRNKDNYHTWLTVVGKPPEIEGVWASGTKTSNARVRKQAHVGRQDGVGFGEEVTTRKRGSIKRAPDTVAESTPIVAERKRGSIRRQP